MPEQAQDRRAEEDVGDNDSGDATDSKLRCELLQTLVQSVVEFCCAMLVNQSQRSYASNHGDEKC